MAHQIQEQGEQILWTLIKKALSTSIYAHGPITRDNMGSAIKRVASNIMESDDLQQYTGEDMWNKVRADVLEMYYKGEIIILRRKVKELQAEVNRLLADASTLSAKQEWIKRLQTTIEQVNKERTAYRRELEQLKGGTDVSKAKKRLHMRHQLTQKISYSLWVLNSKRDGYAEQDWLLAEKLADRILAWKPNGEDNYYLYR